MTSPFKFALLGLFSTSALAHMKLGQPVPYGASTLDNSPLSAQGTDFPCKQRSGVYDISQENTYTVGEDNPLNFIGSAVHGGGSCQISLSTDREPTAKSSFKVIASYIGGCPGTDGGPANFTFKIPDSIPDGKYALAWTWFNRIGNREMYMNCAPATVSGSSAKDTSAMEKLPDMMVANIGNGCSDTESTDPEFPNPGDVVVKGADAKPAPFTGSCAGGTGGSSSSGSSAGASSAAGTAPASSATSSAGGDGSSSGGDNTGQCTGSCLGGGPAGGSGAGSGAASSAAATTAAATSAAPSVPAGGAASEAPAGGASASSGGVFAPGASSAAATSAAAPSPAPNSTSTFTTMQTVTGSSPAAPTGASPTAAPAASSASAAAPAGTGSAGGSTTMSCTDGAIVCNGTDQFALCNHGQVQWMPVAAGTQCQNGQITKRSTGEVVKRGVQHRARRSL